MTIHLFGSVLTERGSASNNHGDSRGGNTCTMQKVVVRPGDCHTMVSAEAIKWAIRHYLQAQGHEVNRVWDENVHDHVWQDEKWSYWKDGMKKSFCDDDLLGFMDPRVSTGGGGGGNGRGARVRRGRLEANRAISLSPWPGDIAFQAQSGMTKKRTSLYNVEMHYCRYQYPWGMTPEKLHVPSRYELALDAIRDLNSVGGCQSRFLFDFSPDAVILRLTHRPTHQMTYCFQEDEDGKVTIPSILRKIRVGDLDSKELYIGGIIVDDPELVELSGHHTFGHIGGGVDKTFEVFKKAVNKALKLRK